MVIIDKEHRQIGPQSDHSKFSYGGLYNHLKGGITDLAFYITDQ